MLPPPPPPSSHSCISYDLDHLLEEELILTPTHSPSQSFDFIVWDKAYLDSIPSMRVPSNHSIRCDHAEGDDNHQTADGVSVGRDQKACSTRWGSNINGGGTDLPEENKNASDGCDPSTKMQEVQKADQEAEVRNHWRLMQACRTDMDLPSCFLQYCSRNKEDNNTMMIQGQRVQAKHGTSLQEAVMRLYDAGHHESYNDHNDGHDQINHDYGYDNADEDYIDYDDHAKDMRPPCNCCGYEIYWPPTSNPSTAAPATLLQGSDDSYIDNRRDDGHEQKRAPKQTLNRGLSSKIKEPKYAANHDRDHAAVGRISEVKIVSVSFRRSFSQPAHHKHRRLKSGLAGQNHANDSDNHNHYYDHDNGDGNTVGQIEHAKVCFPAPHKLFRSPGSRMHQCHGHDHGSYLDTCPHTCSLPTPTCPGTSTPRRPSSLYNRIDFMGTAHFFGHRRSHREPSPRPFTSHTSFHVSGISSPHHTSRHRLHQFKSLWKKLWSPS